MTRLDAPMTAPPSPAPSSISYIRPAMGLIAGLGITALITGPGIIMATLAMLRGVGDPRGFRPTTANLLVYLAIIACGALAGGVATARITTGRSFYTVFLSSINWYKIGDAKTIFSDLGDHAGELETSVMMHVAAGMVRPLREAGRGHERRWSIGGLREGWAWAPRRWTEVSADTGTGNPALASETKGQRYAAIVTSKVADYLVELAAADAAALYRDG